MVLGDESWDVHWVLKASQFPSGPVLRECERERQEKKIYFYFICTDFL